MTTKPATWRELFETGGLALAVIIGGTAVQALETFIGSSMLPTVVADIGGLELFAWNTTLYIVASIVATLFAAVRPRSIGPRGGYLIAAGAFAIGSLLCGIAHDIIVLLIGRLVQGFGAGLLIAQSISMYRIVFPERLWPRMMALNASVWGVGTLLGPALGGIFAEIGLWRWAFLGIVPVAMLLALGAWRVMPATSESRPPARLPIKQILLVTSIVLAVSVASLLTEAPGLAAALVALAIVGVVLLGLAETYSRSRLLAEGTFSLASPMNGLFALFLIIGVSVRCDVFAPLLLQRVHGLGPLWAGYLSAFVAGGWSLAAMVSAGFTGARARYVIAAAPIIMLAAIVLLGIALSTPGGGSMSIVLAGIALFVLGVGIGPAFQQLSARVLATTTAADNDRTSASLGMIQLFASGLGAAISGVAANAAGLPLANTPAELSLVAQALFTVFAIIAALGIPVAVLVTRQQARMAVAPAA